MDFSTPKRALTSLSRRQPPLVDKVKETCELFLKELSPSNDISNKSKSEESWEKVTKGILFLLSDEAAERPSHQSSTAKNGMKKRWEALAVGLYLAGALFDTWTAQVEESTTSDTATGTAATATHYVDGPRLPTTTPTEQSNSSLSSPSSVLQALILPKLPSSIYTSTTATSSESVAKLREALVSYSHAVLLQSCRDHLEHDEPRVRNLVAQTIGAHARLVRALLVYTNNTKHEQDEGRNTMVDTMMKQRDQASDSVVLCLLRQFYRKREADNNSNTHQDASGALPSTTTSPTNKQHPMDDTTGWRALESSLHAYACWMDGCGPSFWCDGLGGEGHAKDLTMSTNTFWKTRGGVGTLQGMEDGCQDILVHVLEQCCTEHVNRHVRAAGLQAFEQLVRSASAAYGVASFTKEEKNQQPLGDGAPLRQSVATVLTKGLSDNWSQVRMAASVLCRTLFLAIQDDPTKVKLYPTLLPRMCLNRFYLAQGVKLYSQETWRMLFDPTAHKSTHAGEDESENGPMQVSLHAAPICRYYAKMCDADNHVVREAACQAIAELSKKLGSNPKYAHYFAPYVPLLLQALIVCFFDESWPVRDEACLACGTFVRAYPTECHPELPVLFERWCEQVTDQIWSVREGAAVALGDAIAAYGEEILNPLLKTKIKEWIKGAKDQPPMTREEWLATHNDPEKHTGSQLYSCGSLAPKLGRGSARSTGGCSDCKMTRPKAPWEATDGCIYMLKELCHVQPPFSSMLTDEVLLPFMQELADVCRVKHFPQADDLRATLWRQLPEMARGLGKKRFKSLYLDMFLDLLGWNVNEGEAGGMSGTSQLSVFAAKQCCVELAGIIGRGIFLGRMGDGRYVDAVEQCLEEGGGAGRGGNGVHGGMPSSAYGPGTAGIMMGAGGPSAGGFPPVSPVPGRMPY